MPVNLPMPEAAALHPVRGVDIGVTEAGIRKKDRKDLLVLRLAPGTEVAGVFTKNRFCAAPVLLCRRQNPFEICSTCSQRSFNFCI